MISIVVITYNNHHQLLKTIGSVENSSIYKGKKIPLEFVFINGGNEEKSKLFLEEWKKNHPMDKVIQEKDFGISDAFNKGINNSTGEYIQFLNSGDLWYENDEYYLRAFTIFQQNEDYSFIHGDIIFNDSLVGEILLKPLMKSSLFQKHPLKFLGYGMPTHHQSMIVKKDAFKQTEYEKGKYFKLNYKLAMDYEWMIRFLQCNNLGYYLPIVSVNMDGDGVSVNKEEESFFFCKKALKENNLYDFSNMLFFNLRFLKMKIRKLVYQLLPRDIIKKIK